MAGQDKLFNAVGLAMRAGRCVSGEFAVEKAIKEQRALLIVLDGAASENTKKQYRSAVENVKIPLVFMNGAGEAIGRPERMALAITDENFVKLIMNAAATGSAEGNTGVETHGK